MKEDTFKEKIFSKIKKERITPLSESYFVNKYRILWLLIGILVLLAILFWGFLIDDSIEFLGMKGYQGGNLGFLIFPNIFWLILIAILILAGIGIFRNTKVGYRYSYISDVIMGMMIVIVGSFVLKGTGIGPNMHSFLVRTIPMVSSVIYNENSWNDPNNGRLAGTVVEINTDKITFESIDGTIWNVNATHAFISPMISLNIGEKIRILGKKNGDSYFEATKIMPWFGQGMGMGGRYQMNGEMMHGSGSGDGMMR
ncbi:MAG: hypothetical protein PHH70_03030 [Candidatus Gracilibacteria bacterium]|nr:hypothetical protein [Candidatus Gracilibacteria bacterium]